MTGLLERVEQNILDRQLLKRNGAVLVAVSGGLDSMSLLAVLRALSSRYRWKLTVGHFNHQLRGRSSDTDERLVRKTAARLKLPFISGRADVRRFARKSKLSIEMAARKLRHEFLARAAKERKISALAFAHHADDQVELFFLRVLRGAGSEGLAGMKWRSPSPADGRIRIIRPLLNVTRAELADFAREHKIHFREDATNAQQELPRNRVRHELLPLLRRHYQPALTKTTLRLMEIAGAEAEFVGGSARQWLVALKKGRGAPRPIPLPAKRGEGSRRSGEGNDFRELPIAIQRRVLQVQLQKLGIIGDFELIERLRCSQDTFISVSRSISVARDSGGKVNVQTAPLARFQSDESRVNLTRRGHASFGGARLRWQIKGMSGKGICPDRRTRCEVFDAEQVGKGIVLRHWRPGDRFQPIGMKSAVKLQDLFTNQRVPKPLRHKLIVAQTANGGIFWVQNLRIAERFKVTRATKRHLVWCWDVARGKELVRQ